MLIFINKRQFKNSMASMGRKRIFLIVFLAGLLKVSAQTEPYLIKNITLESGASQNTVATIKQDKVGYLWFGTTGGLNRYDGYDFRVFSKNSNDSNSISDNSVTSFYEDADGILWIGTVDGVLNRYDKKTGIFHHFDLHISDKYTIIQDPVITEFPVPLSRSNENTLTSIQEDKEGNLWIGTWGAGIIRFDKKTFKPSRYIEDADNEFSLKISKNNVKTILIDSDGNIWIASMLEGLKKMLYNKAANKVSFVRYNLINGRYKQATSLAEDNQKNLYIGTFDGGFFKLPHDKKDKHYGVISLVSILEDAKKTFHNVPGKIMAMLVDKNGFVWLGTYGALLKYDPKKNEINNIDLRLGQDKASSFNVLSLLEDRTGIIWAGFSLGGGICKIENNKIKFNVINKKFPLKNSLNNETIWSVLLDKQDVLWIGTEKGGLNKFDRRNSKFTYYLKNGGNKSISDNCVRCIKEDRWGDLWIGTYNGGLNYFNKSTGEFKSFKTDSSLNSISHNQVQAVYIEDSTSTFWIGTFGGGLNKFQLKKRYEGEKPVITHFRYNRNNPFSLSSDKVYTIYEDKKGTLWVGTFGGGLNKFDKKTGRFIAYKNIRDDESSIEDNRVLAIFEDSKSNLWVATYGGGLNRFDQQTEKFVRYYNENMSAVYAVLEDESNNLWMSSDKGIFKFNYLTKNYTQYHISDGLQGVEFSGGAYFKSPKGEMFFGGTSGLNYFYPRLVMDNVEKPPVVISNIRVFNKSLKSEKDVIELSYSENFISFEFSALDYTNPVDNRYAFMLEGYDENWITTDARARVANYINLAPGTYKFKVRGTNSDAVWNDEGAEVTLIITPLYWQTTWFRILAVLVFIGILYYLFTLRFKGLLEIEKLKTKIAADLHDNVGAGLTEISILSELTSNIVKAGPGGPIKNLDTISEKSRALVDSMSDIVWVVNPKRDSLYDLILRLKDSYSDTFSVMGIAFKTNNLEEFSSIKLPMDYKQNLYLIFKEALNNSIKHSKCKQITLEASIEKENIRLKLTDDGSGFDINSAPKGNGINNIRNRAKLIGGNIEVFSSKEGTTLAFTGKIKRTDKIRLLFNKF
jgi:ligand-binding sensor domain-containing protein/two-component sensor histidine kinase